MYIIAYRDKNGADFRGYPWLRPTSDDREIAEQITKEFREEYKDTILFEISEEECDENEIISWDFVESHKIEIKIPDSEVVVSTVTAKCIVKDDPRYPNWFRYGDVVEGYLAKDGYYYMYLGKNKAGVRIFYSEEQFRKEFEIIEKV